MKTRRSRSGGARSPDPAIADAETAAPLEVAAAATDRGEIEFDTEYYRTEYPDLRLGEAAAWTHFAEIGCWEGRNPNADFDVASYLLLNPDVEAAGENPLSHYLRIGRAEGGKISPAVTPSVVTRRLFGSPVVDWVDRIAPYVDAPRYQAMLNETALGGRPVDPVAHWAFRGWRSGLNPSNRFNTRHWAAHHPQERQTLVNPLLIWLHRARAGVRLEAPFETPVDGPAPLTNEIEAVEKEFSSRYYIARHPEILESGMDPVIHYMTKGWRAGYDPTPEFDTAYYLRANDDVEKAGINPFLHYLWAGRREGRNPSAPDRYVRGFIEDVHRGKALPPKPRRSRPSALALAAADLEKALAIESRGLALSVSHDAYTRSVGGTQIVIADEQSRLNRRNWRYLHLAPGEASLVTTSASKGREFEVTLDGARIGRMSMDDLMPILRAQAQLEMGRLLVIHSALGFASADLIGVIGAFAPHKSAYWVHDYSAICSGFNLLRNDLAFCNAPTPDSASCFVCGHGPSRRGHVAAIEAILAAADFTVLAPSRVAAAIWSASKPGRPATVHPHWTLEIQPGAAAQTRRPERIGLAFIGHPLASKGWPAFEMIADATIADPRFRLFHFAGSRDRTPPGAVFVKTEVSAENRLAMIDNLRSENVAVALILSPWPETFSFIAHEALAAGCLILCLTSSGNVAALVEQTGGGKVFSDVAALLAFLRSTEVAGWVETAMAERRDVVIHETGTTASAFDLSDFPGGERAA